MAICEYLQKQVKIFSTLRLRKKLLAELLKNSKVEIINTFYEANCKNLNKIDSPLTKYDKHITTASKMKDRIKTSPAKEFTNYFNKASTLPLT